MATFTQGETDRWSAVQQDIWQLLYSDKWGLSNFRLRRISVSFTLPLKYPKLYKDAKFDLPYKDQLENDIKFKAHWQNKPYTADADYIARYEDYENKLDNNEILRWQDFILFADAAYNLNYKDFDAVADAAYDLNYKNYNFAQDVFNVLQWKEYNTKSYTPFVLQSVTGQKYYDYLGGQTYQELTHKLIYLDKSYETGWTRHYLTYPMPDIFKVLPWGDYLPLDVFVGLADQNLTGKGPPEFTLVWAGKNADPYVHLRWFKRIVLMINTSFEVKRAYDDKIIHCTGGSVSLDKDSWGWECSLTIASRESAQAIKEDAIPEKPGAVDIYVSVNGYTWLFEVAKVNESYSYESVSYSARAISKANEIGADGEFPMLTKTFGGVAVDQMISSEFTDTGWVVNFSTAGGFNDLLTYSIPNSCWSVRDMPLINFVSNAMKAVGGTVQVDMSSRIIQCKPVMVNSPETWAVENIDNVIPLQLTKTLATETQKTPKYNFAYVTTPSVGGLRIKVALASSYDPDFNSRPMPDVHHALLCNENIMAFRGKAELWQNGFNATAHTIACPLLPASDERHPKLLLPGDLTVVNSPFNVFIGQVQSNTVHFDLDKGTGQQLNIKEYKI